MITAVVLAGGSGTRMQTPKPKQHLILHDQTVLQHTLTLLENPSFNFEDFICVLDDQAFRRIPAKKELGRWKCVLGGNTRAESVRHAMATVKTAWTLLHDAARPVVDPKDVLKLLAEKDKGEVVGVSLATPIRDTVKKFEMDGAVKLVDRSELWLVQTPQLFKTAVLKPALEKALEQALAFTEEAGLLEGLGWKVAYVKGQASNLKLTYPEDLHFFERWLSQRPVESN